MERRRASSGNSTTDRFGRIALLKLLALLVLAEPPSAIGAELDASSSARDDEPVPHSSEGLRGRRRRRRLPAETAVIRPGFAFDSRTNEGGVKRLGTIDVSGLGDLSEVDAEASIRVQLFKDEPPMTFRRIPRKDDPPDGAAATNGARETGGVRTLHAEDVSDDKGYTMSIVSVPASQDDPSGDKRAYVAGSVVTNDTIYDISTSHGIEEGTALVEARRVEDLPDEAEPISLEGVNYTEYAIINATFWNESAYSVDGSSRDLQRIRGSSITRNGGSSVLDVMVVYTPNAMCAQRGARYPCENTRENRGPIEARIILAVEEMNTAFELSGIKTEVRLVHVHLAENIDDSDNELWTSGMTSLLQSLRSSKDGFEYVSALRDSNGADFVSLITERMDFCGLAQLGPSADAAFNIVSRVCSTGYYSFAHELGHNFGCDHNPKAAVNKSPAFARGYRNEEDGIRSILAYECETKRCTRVLRFSNNNDYSFNGMKIGDARHDNARQINLNFVMMSRYRPTKVEVPVGSDSAPTDKPTRTPTVAPTSKPSHAPTDSPTVAPSTKPSHAPTVSPTATPSHTPTGYPSQLPSLLPSNSPFSIASSNPSAFLSPSPTEVLSGNPSAGSTGIPSMSASPSSTQTPSYQPSFLASPEPSTHPSLAPSELPSLIESQMPTTSHTPSFMPSESLAPSPLPSLAPSSNPSLLPSSAPSSFSENPSAAPAPISSLYDGPYQIKKPAVGDWGSYGNQFDLRADKNIRVRGLDIHTSKTSRVEVEVWTRSGSHVNAHHNHDRGWTKIQDVSVFGLGRYTLTPLPEFFSPIVVKAGSVQAFTVVLRLGGIAYSPGKSKNSESIANDDLAIYEGSFINRYYGDKLAAGWLSRNVRVWEGTVFYEIERGGVANEAINREGGTEDPATAKRKRKRKGILSWVADKASNNILANETAKEEQADEVMADLPDGADELAANATNLTSNDPGECFDDPEFHYTFRGMVVNCRWVEENPTPGCGLEEGSVIAFDCCACACSTYGR